MKYSEVVIAEPDPRYAESVANSLRSRFHAIRIVKSSGDLEAAVVRNRVRMAVVDLEIVPLEKVETLSREFGARIVCTHRVPDEKMWADSLQHGAIDCCQANDVRSIVDAVSRDARARTRAA